MSGNFSPQRNSRKNSQATSLTNLLAIKSKLNSMRKIMRQLLPILFGLVLPLLSAAQQQVKGRVTDETGAPLAGATVTVKGTKIVAQTDVNGNFSLNLPANYSKLEISYVGFSAQTITAGAGETIVALKEDDTNLNEVVVTGLASSIKRSNAANSVARIGAKELTGSTRPPSRGGSWSGGSSTPSW